MKKLFFLIVLFLQFSYTPIVGEKKILKVLHISFHHGCLKEFEFVAQQLNLEITSRAAHDLFLGITAGNDIYNVTHNTAQKVWEKHQDYFNTFDVIVTSDTAPLSRIFIQNGWQKPLIVWICNRFDYADGSTADNRFPDVEYYRLFRHAAKMPNVKIIAYTLYEHIYAHLHNVSTGDLVIKPCGSLLYDDYKDVVPSHISKEETLYVVPRMDSYCLQHLEQICQARGIKTYAGQDGPGLDGFKGVLHFPYNYSTLGLFEKMQRGLVHFIPSLDFAKQLYNSSQRALYRYVDGVKESVRCSEWYNGENADAIIYFDSWDDLKYKIEHTDFDATRKKVKAFGEKHRKEMLARWQQVFTDFYRCIYPCEETGFVSSQVLKKYENYLAAGILAATWKGKLPKSRDYTFKKAFEHFEKHKGKVIVETGTSRSFVHGGLPGCLSDNVRYWQPNNPESWDWGAGIFTRVAAECLYHMRLQLHTIDIDANHMNCCKVITSAFHSIIRYHVCSSVDFLKTCNFPQGIDLLYLDTADSSEQAALLQLEEARIIVKRNLIGPNGIILLDDAGLEKCYTIKSKYSLPYFLENGFEIMENEYQIILRRCK